MYSNNRRSNWTYDDDGRVKISPDPTSGGTRNWTYDVAGNATFVSENVSGVTATNTLVYDGDDALLKDTVVNNSSTSSNYLINSTVLGKVLTKLDASGNKEITYVPLNHLRTALEQKDFQANPTIGWVARDASGLQENDRAADPFGNLINNVQPPVVGPPPNIAFYGPGYMNPSNASFTNANNYAMSCVLDGITAPCGQVMRAVNNRTVNLNTLGLSTTGGLADFGNAGLGGLVIDLSNQQRIWKSDKVAPLAPPKLGTYTPGPTRTPLSGDPRGGEASGHWEYFYELSAFFLEPQEPKPQPHPTPTPQPNPCVNAAFAAIHSRSRQTDRARTGISMLLAEAAKGGLTAAQVAYVLATAEHESNMGNSMVESRAYAAGRNYQGGVAYRGRGYVHLTHYSNYQAWGLAGNPAEAANPATAARIAVQGMSNGSFTGNSLEDSIPSSGQPDFYNARWIIIGNTRHERQVARRLAGYANDYLTALSGCGFGQ